MPYTHFTTKTEGIHHLYSTTKCETCGDTIQAPNACHAHEPKGKLLGLGYQELKSLPAEGWHNEETGMECCDNCIQIEEVVT